MPPPNDKGVTPPGRGQSVAHNPGGKTPGGGGGKMGNGASATGIQVVVDGETIDLVTVKMLIPELREQVKSKDLHIRDLEEELQEKSQALKEKTADVARLKAEVHKLRSVLQLKVEESVASSGKPDILATIVENTATLGPETRAKKQGVSGESPSSNSHGVVEVKHHDKDFR